MEQTIAAGNILIQEGTRLPDGLGIKTETYVPGWRVIQNLDGYQLDRKIRKNGWTFFCLAREISSTVFGVNKQNMARRAISKILANPKSESFNSLEITHVSSPGSDRFPLIGCLTVSARSRHVQESPFLAQPENVSRQARKGASAGSSPSLGESPRRLLQQPIKPSAVPTVS